MNTRIQIETLLDSKPNLRPYLFIRGFLISSKRQDGAAYPFYETWNEEKIGVFYFYHHAKTKLFHTEKDGIRFFLIGHAYQPFSMQIDENEILQQVVASATENERYSAIDQISGLYLIGWIRGSSITLVSDCAGMQQTWYGNINGDFYASSHTQLIGDLCGLTQDSYIKRLTSYRFFHYYGAYLPGDLSPYPEVRRVVPNISVTWNPGDFSLVRFYPKRALDMCKTDEAYREKLEYIAAVMRSTMELIQKKWSKPAISMSGGMDSKCTVAAANGRYDRYYLFSYNSMPGEKIDADAAHQIAAAIGAEHHIDLIPDADGLYEDIDSYRMLLEYNAGNIGSNNKNDVRKRVFYLQDGNCPFDIEAKSWVSEIGRANYYKKFGLKKMPHCLSARQMTTMYKLFVHNRKLVYETDRVFKDYIRKTSFRDLFNYDPSDMFLWEMRYGGWGGHVITCEQRFSYDITIPYNNRRLMEAFLTLPLEKRISDQAHHDLIKMMNPLIDKTGITITNYNETKKRMYFEKMYFLIHGRIPF